MGAAERTRLDDGEKLVVSGWLLVERLGTGGYGEVWRARRRHVDIQRALKLVRISGDDAFEGWRHEISRLEELSHPNVVRFYDADIVTEGPYRDHAWIATELCERSLAVELGHRPGHRLAPEEVERLLDQILDALSAALTRGCVHRDIKPGNLLLHSSGVWKLCDFGTARLVPDGATHPVTRVIGTSPYMSAAALRGQQNHAADLYALGVTVHEALCGRLLHPRGADVGEVEYARIVLETPPTIFPNLPRRWQTAIAALTGVYGALDAPTLAAWFLSSRGAEAPPPVPVPGAKPGRTVVTAVTDVVSAASAANGAAPSAAARRQLFVPAPAVPPPPPAGAPGAGAVPALGPGPAVVPPPGAPAPGAPALSAGPVPPGSAAAQGAPGVARRPPPPGLPPQEDWRPAPPLAEPSLRARALHAVDPSKVLRRRGMALAIDLVVTFVLCMLWYYAAVASAYERLPDDAVAATGNPCEQVGDVWDCYTGIPGDDGVFVAPDPVLRVHLTYVVPPLLVFVVLQGLTGYTPGKLARGLRVVGIDRRPPGMRRAFLRSLLWVVDGLPCALPLVGLAVAARRRDHRRVGDLVAGTWVVDRRPPPPGG